MAILVLCDCIGIKQYGSVTYCCQHGPLYERAGSFAYGGSADYLRSHWMGSHASVRDMVPLQAHA